MSLGLLGDYGSESEISDSDEDFNMPLTVQSISEPCPSINHSKSPDKWDDAQYSACGDPLDFAAKGTASESGSDSTSESGDSNSIKEVYSMSTTPHVSLPLPDLDNVVPGDSSLSSSHTTGQQAGSNANSVFYNPYKEAEDAKLAILKKHVVDFDKKPNIKERKKGKNVTEVLSYDPSRRHPRSHGRGPLLSPQGSTVNPTHVNNPSYGSSTGVPGHHHGGFSGSGGSFEDTERSESRTVVKRKHRSGVGESLMPAKKFMKTYKGIQSQERPWTVTHK